MSQQRSGSSLWPVLAGMTVLLVGAMVLEAAGRAREDHGAVVVISSGASLASEEADSGEAPLLGEPLDTSHAQARRLVRRGQYAEASDIFLALLGTFGRQPDLLSELGYLQLIRGDSEVAEATLKEARDLAPDNAWLSLSLATATARNGKAQEAEQFYLEALRIRPHYSAAKLSFGRFLREENRYKEATPLLEEISHTGSNKDRATALVELGRVYLEGGKFEEADDAFTLAIGRAPASVTIRISIARGYIDLGTDEALAKATDVLQRAIQLAPAAAQLQSLLGATLVRRGDVGAGRAAFQKGLDLDPNYLYARRRLLRLDLNSGDYVAARSHAAALLTADPTNSDFQFLMGLVEARDGKLENAREAYLKAIELENGLYPEAHMNLGKLERQAKNYEQSIAYYRLALDARPNYREAKNNLALTLLAAKRSDEALTELQSLVASFPDYAEAWLNLGRTLSSLERNDDAIAALQQAIAVRPGYPAALLNLATILRKSARPEEAVAVYDTILESQPRYVSAWYNRGIALDDSGQVEAARASYEKAFELDVGHLLSLKRLARLELRERRFKRSEELYTELLDRDARDAKSRRLRGETRAGQGDSAGCRQDASLAKKQEPNNSNLQRLFEICNEPRR